MISDTLSSTWENKNIDYSVYKEMNEYSINNY